MNTATYESFSELNIRIGTVISAEHFAEALKPALKLKIDFGSEIGILSTSAQITDYYSPVTLIGRQVVAVVNFPPKQIANFISECLILGAVDSDHKVVLLQTDSQVENGLRIS